MRKTLAALCGFFIACGIAQAQSGTGTVTTSGADCTTVAACANDKISIVDTGNVTIQVTGTWSATLQFEASSDGGTTFVAISGTPLGSTVAVTSATANGTWRFNAAGITDIRVRASAMASGTAAISFRSSKADPTPVGQPATTTSGTASAITQAGYPIMCDTATSGTVTAGQAQMVRCATSGVLATGASTPASDATGYSGGGLIGSNAASLVPVVIPELVSTGSSLYSRQYMCDKTAKLSALAAATTQIVALAASQKIYVCSMVISNNNATATTLKMVEGTGSNCGTGQADISGLMNIGATTTSPISIQFGANAGWSTATAADAICFTSSAASSLEITITYVQHN